MAKATTVGKDHVIVKYLKETRAELRKVTWPTREETINLTLIVIAVIVVMAMLLGTFDWLFSRIIGLIVG